MLRVITLNLWNIEGPHQARMAVVADELRALSPDVVGLQEVCFVEGRVENQAKTLANALGYEFVFQPGNREGGRQDGLAILSRLPIEESSHIPLPPVYPTSRRILLSARVHHKGRSVWAHTTHLHWRLDDGKAREDQVVALSREIARRKFDGVQLLMGDFNAVPESDEIRYMKGLCTLDGQRVFYQDAWEVMHPGDPGLTWVKQNPFLSQWHYPDRRIDYIFVTPRERDGRGRITGCKLVFNEPNEVGVFASDHYGVMADVQVSPDEPQRDRF